MKINNPAEFVDTFGASMLAHSLGIGVRTVLRWKERNHIPTPYIRLLECLTEEQVEHLRARARKHVRARSTTYLTSDHKCAECGGESLNMNKYCSWCGREILYG